VYVPGIPLRQGQFWWVEDDAIDFPENPERDPHSSRGCIIIEGDTSLDRGGLRVLVVPTSSDTSRKDVNDLVIPHPPAPQVECVALIGHVQPILRSNLKNLVQKLPDEWIDKMLLGVITLLDLEAGFDAEEDSEVL
jgi:mRNA-degrading endonuclease toxin of MazEF toxin-antitoxin module